MKKAKSILAILLAMVIALSTSAFAFATTTPSEEETNATPDTANTVGVGSSINAKLDDDTDVDWFVFQTTENGLVTVTLSHSAISGADAETSFFAVEIQGADGVQIESFKSTGSQTEAKVEFSAVPGSYYVKVAMDRQYVDNLTYTVAVKLDSAALVEKEDNDTWGTATEMTMATDAKPGVVYYGTIDKGTEAAGDVDYYKLTVNRDYLLYPGIYNTASNTGNYSLSVIETVDGDGGAAVERSLGTLKIYSNQETVEGSPIGVKAGTYYVKVAGIDNSVGGYQIRIFGRAASGTETEYNNDAKNANTILVGGELTGSLFDETDVDCFTYTTKGNNNGYKITLGAYSSKPETANGQWILVVKNESGNEVCKVDATASEAGVLETDPLSAGTYTFIISKGNVYTDEVYKISFEAKTASDDSDDDESLGFFEDMKAFFDEVGALDWGGFANQFMEWLPSVNVFGMIGDLMNSIVPFITEFLFANT